LLEIRNTKVYGLDESMLRSGYPMRTEPMEEVYSNSTITKRARALGACKQGSGHDNFLKGIIVQFDLKYSLYFTKQMERYHWFDIISSGSTMHTITKRGDISEYCNKYVDKTIITFVNNIIDEYNREENTKVKYELFMKIISNLPSGFELWAGISTNYLQLKTMYNQRKNHKLKEDWGYFCTWCENLPMFTDLVLKGTKDVNGI